MAKDKVNERVWFREWAQVLDQEFVERNCSGAPERDNYEIRACLPLEGKARPAGGGSASGGKMGEGNRFLGAQSLPAYGGASGDQGLPLFQPVLIR